MINRLARLNRSPLPVGSPAGYARPRPPPFTPRPARPLRPPTRPRPPSPVINSTGGISRGELACLVCW